MHIQTEINIKLKAGNLLVKQVRKLCINCEPKRQWLPVLPHNEEHSWSFKTFCSQGLKAIIEKGVS